MKLLPLVTAAMVSIASASTTIAAPVPTEQANIDLKSTHQPRLDLQARAMTLGKRQLVAFPRQPTEAYASPFLPPDVPVFPPGISATTCKLGNNLEKFPSIYAETLPVPTATNTEADSVDALCIPTSLATPLPTGPRGSMGTREGLAITTNAAVAPPESFVTIQTSAPPPAPTAA